MSKPLFRVLDLGSHDGFVTLWLARQLRERGIDVDICGLELHSGAVEISNRRAEAEGFIADYRIGLAEDAETHWTLGSFDAVVSFEVIEHVPDVDKFLSACERMCKIDGRVYLSTPNGCFGTGQNPHHLRVYRDIDLFNVMRRRGKVVDLHQGSDGVTVACYTPMKERVLGLKGRNVAMPEAVVYVGPGWEKWHPRDIETKGLGGSETAAAMVAYELTELGFAVTLYGEVEEGMWRNVELRHHSLWDPLEQRDLTIVSRIPQALDRPINSKGVAFWMHDTDYGDALTPERVSKAILFTLSQWHHDHVWKTYPWLTDIDVTKTTNGIQPDFFPLDKIPTDRPKRAIFSSSPDRGLDFLVNLWPRVREQVPDAELVYCYSAVYDKVAEHDPRLREFRKDIDEVTNQHNGIVNLGPLSQPDLASAMATCRLWLHPSYNGIYDVPFHETFCIGAVEAAAAGCHRIMSPWGALTERQEGDFTFVPDMDEDEWVAQIVRHLQDDEARTYHSFPDARKVTWKQTAQDFAALAVG